MNYQSIAVELAELVEKKQKAYGDSFGKAGDVLRIFYPDGIPPEKLDDALTIVRVVDKLMRIATDRDAFGEDPWKDVLGYALLSVGRRAGGSDSVPPDQNPAVAPLDDAMCPRRCGRGRDAGCYVCDECFMEYGDTSYEKTGSLEAWAGAKYRGWQE